MCDARGKNLALKLQVDTGLNGVQWFVAEPCYNNIAGKKEQFINRQRKTCLITNNMYSLLTVGRGFTQQILILNM